MHAGPDDAAIEVMKTASELAAAADTRRAKRLNWSALVLHAIAEGDGGSLKMALAPNDFGLDARTAVTADGKFGDAPLCRWEGQGLLAARMSGDNRHWRASDWIAVDGDTLEGIDLAKIGVRDDGNYGLAGGLFLCTGDTILHAIVRNVHVPRRAELLEAVMKCGPDLMAKNARGWTALAIPST